MPLPRDTVEEALRRWEALERAQGHAPVIDFDCAPPAAKPPPFNHRFAALDELTRLRTRAESHHPELRTQLDAHLTYLGTLIGQQHPLEQYLRLTQGCPPHGWTQDYLEQRAWIARDALASLGISWDQHTRTNLHAASEQLPATDVGAAIAEYADKYEPSIRRLVDTDTRFSLRIEDVDVDAYWSYWLDGAGHDARLRINKKKASSSRTDAYHFALHEVLGHALQYASLIAHAASHTVEWPRILAVHCPYQVTFEGLAQVLPGIASPEDDTICARTRVDHFTNLIRRHLHILINSGATTSDCRELARRHIPWWTDGDIARELYDRSRDPQLRSYLWSYPAGMDWFVRLVEKVGTTTTEVLRETYRRPLTPGDLHQLWPTDRPTRGGNQ